MPEVIGVVGAGTMGAGIAQLAAAAGARTLLHDPVPEARERGLDRSPTASSAGGPRAAGARARRVAGVAELDALAEAGLVIEAAPERLELKRELFAAPERRRPERRAGLQHLLDPDHRHRQRGGRSRARGRHAFFNPAPIMALVEVIAGIDSSPEALDVARATGRAMGKHVIDATDGPGFLVNRCNRPFGLEALKLLQERVADVETIDAIARAAAFAWGPSSCRTSSASTSATRSRSPSTRSASASRAGGPPR